MLSPESFMTATRPRLAFRPWKESLDTTWNLVFETSTDSAMSNSKDTVLSLPLSVFPLNSKMLVVELEMNLSGMLSNSLFLEIQFCHFDAVEIPFSSFLTKEPT